MCGSQSPAARASVRMPIRMLQVFRALDVVAVADLGLGRLDDLLDELADAEPDRLQLGAQGEIDRHGDGLLGTIAMPLPP